MDLVYAAKANKERIQMKCIRNKELNHFLLDRIDLRIVYLLQTVCCLRRRKA